MTKARTQRPNSAQSVRSGAAAGKGGARSRGGAAAREAGGVTVLVAEDEPTMLNLIAGHVRRLGVQVLEAGDGDAAWALAQKHVPDLVILDVMMPGMSGWDICRKLKGPGDGGRFAETGVIMLTGIGESLNEMTSPLFKADAWLNKPFQFSELDARVRETLATYGKPTDGAGAKAPARPASRVAAPAKRAGAKGAAKVSGAGRSAKAPPATKAAKASGATASRKAPAAAKPAGTKRSPASSRRSTAKKPARATSKKK